MQQEIYLDLCNKFSVTPFPIKKPEEPWTIKPCVLVNGEDDVAIRGWKLPLGMTQVLANLPINHLTLWNVSIPDISILSPLFQRLVTLKLDQNPGINSQLAILFEDFNLKYLSLASNELGDEGAAIVANGLRSNHTLLGLELFNNYITPHGMHEIGEALKINSTLSFLSLSNNKFGDEGIHFLCESLRNIQLPVEEVVKRKQVEAERLKQEEEEAKKKGKAKPDDKKKPVKAPAKTEKKGKRDRREELQETMFEVENSYYMIGNRFLNRLDVSFCDLTIEGVQQLLSAIHEQELANEYGAETLGLYELNVQGNLMDKEEVAKVDAFMESKRPGLPKAE